LFSFGLFFDFAHHLDADLVSADTSCSGVVWSFEFEIAIATLVDGAINQGVALTITQDAYHAVMLHVSWLLLLLDDRIILLLYSSGSHSTQGGVLNGGSSDRTLDFSFKVLRFGGRLLRLLGARQGLSLFLPEAESLFDAVERKAEEEQKSKDAHDDCDKWGAMGGIT
jgi:hypothetical protein